MTSFLHMHDAITSCQISGFIQLHGRLSSYSITLSCPNVVIAFAWWHVPCVWWVSGPCGPRFLPTHSWNVDESRLVDDETMTLDLNNDKLSSYDHGHSLWLSLTGQRGGRHTSLTNHRWLFNFFFTGHFYGPLAQTTSHCVVYANLRF